MKKPFFTMNGKGEVDIMVVNDGFCKMSEDPNPASEVDPNKPFTPKKPSGERVVNR